MNDITSQPYRPPCPYCQSKQILKNGSTHHKKPKFLCKSCGRQFIENPQKKYRTEPEKNLIDKLLLERVSLRGIARVLGMSVRSVQEYINKFYRSITCQFKVFSQKTLNLVLECDEIWSFVGSKANQVYIWLALERTTRYIVGVYFGDRSRKSAEELWNSLPEIYRTNAQVYTDFWVSYEKVIPEQRHHPSDKSE